MLLELFIIVRKSQSFQVFLTFNLLEIIFMHWHLIYKLKTNLKYFIFEIKSAFYVHKSEWLCRFLTHTHNSNTSPANFQDSVFKSPAVVGPRSGLIFSYLSVANSTSFYVDLGISGLSCRPTNFNHRIRVFSFSLHKFAR